MFARSGRPLVTESSLIIPSCGWGWGELCLTQGTEFTIEFFFFFSEDCNSENSSKGSILGL